MPLNKQIIYYNLTNMYTTICSSPKIIKGYLYVLKGLFKRADLDLLPVDGQSVFFDTHELYARSAYETLLKTFPSPNHMISISIQRVVGDNKKESYKPTFHILDSRGPNYSIKTMPLTDDEDGKLTAFDKLYIIASDYAANNPMESLSSVESYTGKNSSYYTIDRAILGNEFSIGGRPSVKNVEALKDIISYERSIHHSPREQKIYTRNQIITKNKRN